MERSKRENRAEEDSRPLRFVTATSLFDGHDAAINVIRRLIQARGAEVVHLGHNRSVAEVVRAAIQEDADAIAISSYQGGHMEYFSYLLELLREYGAEHIKVFGGGGGTITLEEKEILESAGVCRIYHPAQGMEMGLVGMVDDLFSLAQNESPDNPKISVLEDKESFVLQSDINDEMRISQIISAIEDGSMPDDVLEELKTKWSLTLNKSPVVGITGTGGAGKSSVVDELLERFLQQRPDIRIAVLAVDPTRRKTGGALLGDRIRMNAIKNDRVYMRSLATRQSNLALSKHVAEALLILKAAKSGGAVETAGIGQSDSQIVDVVDLSIYVMTSDYGAATQLEKIDMIDYADVVILNKFEKRGSEDALRDIRKQWQRNHNAFGLPLDEIPVYSTIASQFNDPGLNYAFYSLCRLLVDKKKLDASVWIPAVKVFPKNSKSVVLIPENRIRYLADISEQGRQIRSRNLHQTELASEAFQSYRMLLKLQDELLPNPFELYSKSGLLESASDKTLSALRLVYQDAISELSKESIELLQQWPEKKAGVEKERYSYSVRGKDVVGDNFIDSLSLLKIPKVAAPQHQDWGEVLNFLLAENLPGSYPYTAGVFPYRRAGEDPARMFAGEGTPERTNRRFHYVSLGMPAKRLSTAFDSVTLYGNDPGRRPDIYGKIGNAGVVYLLSR